MHYVFLMHVVQCLRDLSNVANPELQDLTIGMIINTDYGLEGHDLLVRIEEHLTELHWHNLVHHVSVCKALKTLRISIDFRAGDADAILLQVVHDVVAKKLPDHLRDILQVVDSAHCDV